MEQNNSSKAFKVASIVSLVISGLAVASVSMVGVMFIYGRSGGSATAITNEAVIGIAGVMLFIVCAWVFGAIGGCMGIVLTIIGLVKKYSKQVWMPILSVVLGVSPFVIVVLLAMLISA